MPQLSIFGGKGGHQRFQRVHLWLRYSKKDKICWGPHQRWTRYLPLAKDVHLWQSVLLPPPLALISVLFRLDVHLLGGSAQGFLVDAESAGFFEQVLGRH